MTKENNFSLNPVKACKRTLSILIVISFFLIDFSKHYYEYLDLIMIIFFGKKVCKTALKLESYPLLGSMQHTFIEYIQGVKIQV